MTNSITFSPKKAGLLKKITLFKMAGVVVVMTASVCAHAKPLRYALPDEAAALKAGAGMETALNNCSGCHSVDYIATQPPKKGKAFWETEVQKMIKLFGAPIQNSDVTAIADYLAEAY